MYIQLRKRSKQTKKAYLQLMKLSQSRARLKSRMSRSLNLRNGNLNRTQSTYITKIVMLKIGRSLKKQKCQAA